MIKDFIYKNKRVPRINELVETVPELGSSIMPNSESSASKMNLMLEQVLGEQEELISSLRGKQDSLIARYNVFNARAESTLLQLKDLERNVNKDLLLFSKSDEFLYGIVEHFNDHKNINKAESTNYTVTNGKLTLGYSQVGVEALLDGEVSYSTRNRIGNLVGNREFSSFSNILRKDNNFYKNTVYSNIENDIVDFIIDIKFQVKRKVEELLLVVEAIEINSPMKLQCYYTKDNVNYEAILESDSRMTQNENFLTVNQEDVIAIKLILSKYNADTREQNKFGYIFAIDYFGLMQRTYRIDKESTVYLGPYEIKSPDNKPVYYSLATLRGGTCCIVDNQASVDFYLSKDNVNWLKADYQSIENDIVTFDSITDNIEDSTIFTRLNVGDDIFASSNNKNISLRANERLLNYYIKAEDNNKFNIETLTIKKNIKKEESLPLPSGSYSGWKKTEESYECYFIVKEREGRYINFGTQSCFINNREVSGKVFLKKGKHHIKTTQYKNISLEKAANVSKLREADSLYPYNHKYLIEGYEYPSNFIGDKIYQGLSEVYETELKLINKTRFEAVTSETNVYCMKEINGELFFILRFETGENLTNQEFEIESKTRVEDSTPSNLLFIKIVLKSSNASITPKIDQIQVRVI